MGDSSTYSNEDHKKRIEFVEATLQQLRCDNIDSRTLCGRLERGWVRWSALRRAQQRHLVRELWAAGSAGIHRAARAKLLAGNDSGEKLLRLADPGFGIDPGDFFIVDAFWVEYSMVVRGMAPKVEGLSQMEASALIREEACELAERLAQRAYAERCNLLYMLYTASFPDAAEFLRVRCESADMDSRYGFIADVDAGTIRAIIERYRRGDLAFEQLVEHIVSRWAARPPKPSGPADWGEVYIRAEMKRDDDDLYWISVAEDLGILTVEEAETLFGAIHSAAGLVDRSAADYQPDARDDGQWRYFVARDGALIRVSASASAPSRGQFYWGADAGWMPTSPGCRDWAESARNTRRFREVDDDTARSIQGYLDARPGGVFRRGVFWFDQARQWTAARALRRIAELEAATGDIVMYWTWQEYQSDLDELARLRAFLEAGDVEAMHGAAR